MEVKVKLDQSLKGLALAKTCTRNWSDDSDPFCMSELNIFDIQTQGPITKQNIYYFLYSFFANIPIERYQKYMLPNVLKESNKGTDSYYMSQERQKVEPYLRAYLSENRSFVRSPLRKENYQTFIDELYAYLGSVKFFVVGCGNLFTTPNYYCDNINILIITQNKQPQTQNKLALFSFFSPD